MKVTESVAIELRLNEAEVEIMLDYFKYGKEKFSIEEMAFINGKSPSTMSPFHLHQTEDFLCCFLCSEGLGLAGGRSLPTDLSPSSLQTSWGIHLLTRKFTSIED